MLSLFHSESPSLTRKRHLFSNRSVFQPVIVHMLPSVPLQVLPPVVQQQINAVLASDAPRHAVRAEFVKAPGAAAHRK